MNKKQEEGIDRNWHPEFQKYTEAIVSAPEYEGLYFERKKTRRLNGLLPRNLPPDRNVWHGGTRNARNWVFP